MNIPLAPLLPICRALGVSPLAPTRSALLAGCVSLWALRLGGYLFYRVLRVRAAAPPPWGGAARQRTGARGRAAAPPSRCLRTRPYCSASVPGVYWRSPLNSPSPTVPPTSYKHPPTHPLPSPQVGKDARLDQFFQAEGEPLLTGPSK